MYKVWKVRGSFGQWGSSFTTLSDQLRGYQLRGYGNHQVVGWSSGMWVQQATGLILEPSIANQPCAQILTLCDDTYPQPFNLATALAAVPCLALGRLQSLTIRMHTLAADMLQLVGAQLTQLVSLSVWANDEVTGPDRRPVPAVELLGSLPALSRLTRLTWLVVLGKSSAGLGGPAGLGAPAGDVLLALPPGAPLKQVGAARF